MLSPYSPLFPYTTLFRSGTVDVPSKRVVGRRVVVRIAGSRGDRQLLRERKVAKQRQLDFAEALEYLERRRVEDRKSTRLNSSHLVISYAVFCLKKKN